jgi:hypothetical protein
MDRKDLISLGAQNFVVEFFDVSSKEVVRKSLMKILPRYLKQ